MGAWHTGCCGPEAPWCGWDLGALNTAITNLCTYCGTNNYQVTAFDLSGFPDL